MVMVGDGEIIVKGVLLVVFDLLEVNKNFMVKCSELVEKLCK